MLNALCGLDRSVRDLWSLLHSFVIHKQDWHFPLCVLPGIRAWNMGSVGYLQQRRNRKLKNGGFGDKFDHRLKYAKGGSITMSKQQMPGSGVTACFQFQFCPRG